MGVQKSNTAGNELYGYDNDSSDKPDSACLQWQIKYMDNTSNDLSSEIELYTEFHIVSTYNGKYLTVDRRSRLKLLSGTLVYYANQEDKYEPTAGESGFYNRMFGLYKNQVFTTHKEGTYTGRTEIHTVLYKGSIDSELDRKLPPNDSEIPYPTKITLVAYPSNKYGYQYEDGFFKIAYFLVEGDQQTFMDQQYFAYENGTLKNYSKPSSEGASKWATTYLTAPKMSRTHKKRLSFGEGDELNRKWSIVYIKKGPKHNRKMRIMLDRRDHNTSMFLCIKSSFDDLSDRTEVGLYWDPWDGINNDPSRCDW